MGSSALVNNIEGRQNVAIGQFALFFNNYVPRTDSSQASHNVGIGSNVFRENYLGSNNTGVGNFAGMRVSGNKNTIIGANTKRLLADPVAFINGAVFLGHNAGSTENTSDKLYIENTSANKDSSLIYGDFANDSLQLNAKTIIRDNAVVKGFTKLGGNATDVPAIKMKKIIGVGPVMNGNIPIAHGLNAAKILSVQMFMEYGATPSPTKTLPPNYTLLPGYEYQYEIDGANILITNKGMNSANISNKNFKMLLTYEQ
jgi:hypothetical protein